MVVICTGQSGLNKGEYLDKVCKIASEHKKKVKCYHIGELMYKKDSSISKGRILHLPYRELKLLRENVFKDILKEKYKVENIIINTHATFRWHQGLFSAFSMDIIQDLKPNIFITFMDDVDRIKLNLLKRKDIPQFTLKDIIIWREEEILATEILASSLKCSFYIIPIQHPPYLTYRLIFEKNIKKVYVSFPISHVLDKPKVMKEIKNFREEIQKYFVAFDPYTITEKRLTYILRDVKQKKDNIIEIKVDKKKLKLPVEEVDAIIDDIDGQIVARDFKMIEQSDMIIAFIPEAEGVPIISSGVERELQHAYDTTKEVYVIWQSTKAPSPFIEKTSTEIFSNIKEAKNYFIKKRYISD